MCVIHRSYSLLAEKYTRLNEIKDSEKFIFEQALSLSAIVNVRATNLHKSVEIKNNELHSLIRFNLGRGKEAGGYSTTTCKNKSCVK